MLPALAVGGMSGLASLLGALLGKSQNPTIDPGMLKNLFGPNALAGDTQQLYKLLLNSPAFSQMMNSSALRGQNIANQTRAGMASRGLSSTPYAGFLNAAGQGYGATLQRQGQQDLFMKALQEAMQNLGQRESIWGQSQLGRQEQPTWGRMIGASLLAGGSQGFGSLLKQ